jgi:hypothetical protein
MPAVRLGNSAPKHQVPRLNEAGEIETVDEPLDGNRVTKTEIPDSYTRQAALRTVTHDDGFWKKHSYNAEPDWVESDDPELAAALGLIYGCPVGRPDEWEGLEE